MIDFIGVGAQKAGTSWVYACLFEHPEVCAPVKEIHFFSRPRYEVGVAWYEEHFKRCREGQRVGEFSTSYLYSEVAAARIAAEYPSVRLIAILRNPLTRAYSQYGNAIKAGEINANVSFADYVANEPSCLEQGKYFEQLERYYERFPQEQILVLLYEEIEKQPLQFIQSIYRHIGVNDTFVPPSLETRINVARVPKLTSVDFGMHKVAEFLRRHGLSKLVHRIKRSGLTDAIRSVNTKRAAALAQPDLVPYQNEFVTDAEKLSNVLGRDMRMYWHL